MLKQLAILTFFFSWALTFAQEPIRYTTKQGLPSNHIYDIQEDADGFMWFATNRGLAKFDGETFKTFTIQDGLPNNDTWLLDLDAQGKLWYFSKSSYQGYILKDSIYKFQTADKKVISPRYNYKANKKMWFYSAQGMQTVEENKIKQSGIYAKHGLHRTTNQMLNLAYKSKLNIEARIYNPANKEFALCTTENIFFFDYNFELVSSLKQKSPTYNRSKINTRGSLFNNVSYIAFDSGILFINFKSKTSKFITYSTYTKDENVLYFKCKGLKDEIQISIPGHLLIFNYDFELVDSYTFPKISSNRISYKDSRGNIWLADFTNGVSLIPNTQLQSKYYLKTKKTQKLGIIDHQLIAGINNDGFYTYSQSKNNFESIVNNMGASNNEIYKIKANPNYLISGLNSYNYINNRAKRIELISGDWNFPSRDYNSFKDVIQYKNAKYYISANSIAEELGNKPRIIVNKSGLLQGEVFNDKLYFTGSDGLHKLENDSLIKPIIESDLLNIPVNTMIAKDNDLWVGTDGRGVYRYNEENVVQLEETDGLSIQRIIKENNTLWLATQKGVIKVDLNSKAIEESKIIDTFYEADGLLQNNTNDIEFYDNYLYAASDIGVAKLDLENKIYTQEPKLYFKSQSDTLNFENSERDNISVTFASQNYSNQENLKYEYRLLPIQSEWMKTASNTLNFTNLSPDLFTLEVKGSDQHNNIGIIKKHLNIIPKWWQTKLALFGFGILTICFLLALIRLLKKRIRNKERTKIEQDKRIVGLELQALRSQMNPHFVHNSLNAIQYFIQRKEVELSEDYLVKFSKLIRLFFEYSRRQTIAIEEELELLTYYLEIEKLRFEEKLTYQITVSENIDQEEQLIPSMLLQPLLENAVNHGLFHKQGNGIVEVDFIQLDENTIKVTVKDDGVGVYKAKEIYKHSSKNYQSNSSAVLQERLDLLNLSKEWEISYTIQDRSNINNEEGTLVILTFKHLIV